MNIENIEILTLNPHYFAKVLSCFLAGYAKDCPVKIIFMVLPILLFKPARDKLVSANKNSRLETLFQNNDKLEDGTIVSNKTRFLGYMERYELLLEKTKEVIIILFNDGVIDINQSSIINTKVIMYDNFIGVVRMWMKAAYYLGVVFSKTNIDNINTFLEVE